MHQHKGLMQEIAEKDGGTQQLVKAWELRTYLQAFCLDLTFPH